jgi:superfamily II helicase
MSRSQSYQHIFHEQTYDDNQWKTIEALQNYTSVKDYLTAHHDNETDIEYLSQLDYDLQQKMWEIIMEYGTENQVQTCQLIYAGKTQQEAADIMNVDQTTVFKNLRGNYDYKQQCYYGGVRNKLTKQIKQSKSIHDIMRQIDKCQIDGKAPHYVCFRRLFHTNMDYYQWLQKDLP